MSVGTAMFNNNNHHHPMGGEFKTSHSRSRSYNELLSKFKQQITNVGTTGASTTATTANSSNANTSTTTSDSIRSRGKRSHSEIELNENDEYEIENFNNKRSRTAPPTQSQSPSPEITLNSNVSNNSSPTLNSNSTFKLSSKSPNIRSRSLSPNKMNKITKPEKEITNTNNFNTTRNSIDNGVIAYQQSKIEQSNIIEDSSKGLKNLNNSKFGSTSKSDITLPSISTVLTNDIKKITPTTSLDYFDTYKPNDENWRYGLLDSIKNGNKNQKSNNNNNSNVNTNTENIKPIFNSKISKPVLPPIKFESERKINFPYESNYTYLNKTYLNDVAKYPEYLELAQSLVQLSRSDNPNPNQSTNANVNNLKKSGNIDPPSVPVQVQMASPVASAATTLTSPKGFPPLYPYQVQQQQQAQQQAQQQVQQQQFQQQQAQQQQQQNVNVPYPAYQNYQQPPQPLLYSNQYQSYQPYMASPQNTVYAFQSNYPHPTTQYVPEQPVTPPKKHSKFIPITPPSSKAKQKENFKTSPKNHPPRICISCGSDQSPCWRPSWSSKEGQLCNSCGLRYKKTSARCLNNDCKKIPAKGEWSLMLNKGLHKYDDGEECYSCLECGYKVEVKR